MHNFIPFLLSIAKVHTIASHLPSTSHSLSETLDTSDPIGTNFPIQPHGCDWCRKLQPHGKHDKSERICKRASSLAKHVFLTCLEPDRPSLADDFPSTPPNSIVREFELFRLDRLCVMDLRSLDRLQTRMREIEKSFRETLNRLIRKTHLHEHLYGLRGLFLLEKMEVIGPFCEFIFPKVCVPPFAPL
jgi:hypothetical protein